MTEKAIEAFFRHWLLILLPVFVIPLDVTAWVFSTPPQYEAQAGVWVERPTYLAYTGDELTRYLPPATVQRNRLDELMRTSSFIADVVTGTALEPLLSTRAGQAVLDQIFARDFDDIQNGDHLLVVRFRSEVRDTALQVVSSIVTQFRNRAAEDRRAQAQVAISFYQGRVNDNEGTLTQARADLAKYLAANPRIAATLANQGLDIARLDPQFAELQRRVDTAKQDADNARNYLAQAQLDVSVGIQSDTVSFRIVDAAGVSDTPSRQLKKVLVYPLVALLAGLAIGAALLALFTLSDHSVRSLSDLAPDTVILGVMPHLQAVASPRPIGAHATRRAIGSVAGVPLPSGSAQRAS